MLRVKIIDFLYKVLNLHSFKGIIRTLGIYRADGIGFFLLKIGDKSIIFVDKSSESTFFCMIRIRIFLQEVKIWIRFL